MSHSDSFHKKAFDKGTQCKLDLYRRYLRAWLPVFLNCNKFEHIQIFDFFAGPGTDGIGNQGSPLIAIEEVKKALEQSNSRLKSEMKISLFFNELDCEKFQSLQLLCSNFECIPAQTQVTVTNESFNALFLKYQPIMRQFKTANFIFIDQFGLKEVSKEIFQTLIDLPATDFLFYLSASTANRFKDIESVIKYIPPIPDDDKKRMNGDNVLWILAKAYREQWMPNDRQYSYFLGNFSIKKGANVYGLIFGSRHPLGIDKFLAATDELGGAANFDIEHDGTNSGEAFLFPEMSIPTRIQTFQKELEALLRTKIQKNNHWLYGFGLINGVRPKYVKEVIKKLKQEGFIKNKKLNISYDAWKAPAVEIEYSSNEDKI